MKIKLYLKIFLACSIFASCVEDPGNYDYTSPDEITPIITSSFEEHYDVITFEQFVLEPTMGGDETQYDYLWYAYPSSLPAIPADTIGYEKNLNYNMVLEPGTYTVVFKATNKGNNISAYQKTEVSVSSNFGIGFYVNKFENGFTDIDFIDREGIVNPNVLSRINGEALDGHPINSAYFSVGYAYEVEDAEGNITKYNNQPGYMVCSDNDFRIYHGQTMQELNSFETAFMELPTVKKPQGVIACSLGYLLINDNQAHRLVSGSHNFGKFGYPFPNRDFKYSKYVISGLNSFITFDENSSLFLGYNSSKNEAITDDTYSDYNLLYLGAKPYALFYTLNSFALLKHKTENKAVIAKITSTYVASSVFRYVEYQVPETMGVLNANIFAISGSNDVLYYSTGDNKVRYYNFGNQTEQNVLTLPTDEKVVYIKNVYDLINKTNFLLVLTDKGNSWNLHKYSFQGSTPDVALPATATYSGTGTPSTVVYRDANTYVTY